MNIYIPSKEDIKEIVKEALSDFKPVILPDDEKLLTKEETGELLGNVSNSTVDNLRRKGIIKPYRFLGTVRFKRAEVLKAIDRLNQ